MKVQNADTPWVTAFFGLGGNVGTQIEIAARFQAALQMLEEDTACRIEQVSSIYCTPAWGVVDQAPFLNAVVKVLTAVHPLDLLELCKDIEQRLGRVPRARWGPREIDIDILLYGTQRLQDEKLQLPHAGLLERAFAWVPLLEIAPDAQLPGGTAVEAVVDKADVAAGEIQQLPMTLWQGSE